MRRALVWAGAARETFRTLAGVAFGHATDMARHNYFEHEDLAGHSPADRVRAVGYREKLVGENIAYGPKSAEEVVQGWLESPGHCENIMDPRFAEMGIAYAAGQASGAVFTGSSCSPFLKHSASNQRASSGRCPVPAVPHAGTHGSTPLHDGTPSEEKRRETACGRAARNEQRRGSNAQRTHGLLLGIAQFEVPTRRRRPATDQKCHTVQKSSPGLHAASDTRRSFDPARLKTETPGCHWPSAER